MSAGKPKPPPVVPRAPPPKGDEDSGASVQLRILTAFMLKEFMKPSTDEIDEVMTNYGVRSGKYQADEGALRQR